MSLSLVAEGSNKGLSKFEKGSKEWADKLRKETKTLSENIEKDYLRLAQNLWLLFDTPVDGNPHNTCWLTRWGYGHIGEYAQKELGINKRIADRLRRMWKVVGVDCKLTKEDEQRFLDIGRSKARIITRPFVMDDKTAPQWIGKAEKMTYLALEEEVDTFLAGRAGIMKGTLGKVEATDSDGDVVEDVDDDETPEKPGTFLKTMHQLEAEAAKQEVKDTKPSGSKDDEEPEKLHHKTFAFYPDQWDTVKAAMERSQELSGSKVDSNNMSLICLDFLATNEFKSASMEQTQRFLKRLEKALTVKIIALSPKDNEVLYGYKLLGKLVNGK